MRKRRGLTGMLFSLILFGLFIAFMLAMLPKFNWDIFSFFEWIIGWIWYAIERVASYFKKNETFNDVFETSASFICNFL